MFNPRNFFNYISYLQYPLMVGGLVYSFMPFLYGFESVWEYYNNTLIFMGVGISFSTLQDTTKMQNELSRKVWENPKTGKLFLGIISATTLLMILVGFYGLYSAEDTVLKELSLGVLVLGIGLIGLLKSAIELFENHRLDKKVVL